MNRIKTNNSIKYFLNSKTIQEFCKKHNIKYLSLFGSYARGDRRGDSDVDFIVKFKNKVSIINIIEAEMELGDILNKKVQFVEKEIIPKELKESIDREKVVIYEK